MNSISREERGHLTVKLSRMQRELAKLVENFYQQQIEYDDDLQALTSRAFDDVRELTEYVRTLEPVPNTNEVA